ncbi:fungal specific transcription factor domain-containing protein [Stemphylium lycopersici]|nr:fungal specific transcription factor domain-containing protein [Stemphylium lycopersici]
MAEAVLEEELRASFEKEAAQKWQEEKMGMQRLDLTKPDTHCVSDPELLFIIPKIKCEDSRPCTNCLKGDEECLPTQPAPRPHVDGEYVRVLEKRVAELESIHPQQSLDHLAVSRRVGGREPNNQRSPSDIGVAAGSSATSASSPAYPRPIAPQRRSTLSGQSPSYSVAAAIDDDEPDLNHLVFGLIASPSAQYMHLESRVESTPPSPAPRAAASIAHALVASIPPEIEETLLETYRERAQAQYPFFHWNTFLSWHSEWKDCPPSILNERAWQGFFINLVYATSFVLMRQSYAAKFDARAFYNNGISLLPAVMRHPDRIVQVQAYLLLSIHALHQSSTERIITLASTTMRQCVQQQLHLFETEPKPVNVQARLAIQVRRRCFWCAYLLDRLVMSAFDLPPSIPDSMITVRPFANIDDHNLLGVAVVTPSTLELKDDPDYTSMSSALHILQCRRIQSEISAVTLRWDYDTQFENTSDWRIRILAELENYKSRVQKFSDPQSKGYTSQRWQAMIYHYTLLMLYRPTKANVVGSAGDWSVQASCQACLMFRRTQIDRQIAQPWLALLVQFQSGITLLYCFWATAPEHRSENYESLDVPDALRACSNILAIMAERWAKADCLRDVFELLAREIPLIDRPNKPLTRLSEKTCSTIRAHLPQVCELVVHRPVLRMIEEMITEDFPRLPQPCQPPSVAGMLGPVAAEPDNHHNRQLRRADSTFQMPFSIQQPFEYGVSDSELQHLDVDALLSFPGVFDFGDWP